MKLPLILFLLFPLFAFSQADSSFRILEREVRLYSHYDSLATFRKGEKAIQLAQQQNYPTGEARIRLLYGNYYYYRNQLSLAKEQYSLAHQIAQQAGDISLRNLCRIRLTFILADEESPEEAIALFAAILRESRQLNDPINSIECLNALGILYEMQRQYEKSLQLYFDALRIAEASNNEHYEAIILNNLGLLCVESGDIDEAVKDFARALPLAEKTSNPRLASNIYNNLGTVYLSQGNFEEAVAHFTRNLDYAKRIGQPREMGAAYVNMASAYTLAGEPKQALAYYDSAIHVFDSKGLVFGLSDALAGKAEILIREGRTGQAEALLERVQLVAERQNDSEMLLLHQRLHSELFEKQGRYHDALQAHRTFDRMRDSLSEASSREAIIGLRKNIQTEKEKNELTRALNRELILKQEAELNRIHQGILLVSIIAIILATGVFLYIRYIGRMRKQQEFFSRQLIDRTEEERSRIARDLHDDLGQALLVTKAKIERSPQSEVLTQNLVEEMGLLIEKTRNLSRQLYPSYLEKIGFIRSVARMLEQLQESSFIECSYEIDKDADALPISFQTHLFRITQECVNNTLRHAGATALKVSLEKTGQDFTFTYLDNGRGLSKASSTTRGMGFLSIRERAKMLGGDLSIQDSGGKGFKLLIKF